MNCHSDPGNSCYGHSIDKSVLHHPSEVGTQVFDDGMQLCCEARELQSNWVVGYAKTGIEVSYIETSVPRDKEDDFPIHCD